MAPLSAPEREARRLLDLARTDREAVRSVLRTLSVDDQVALVCELPASARAKLLEVLPRPEDVIPALPEAELCFTAKAVGLADAGWILEHATEEQVQACLDLDVWREDGLDPKVLDGWFGALADAGGETLLRGARGIDPELLYLFLRSRISAELKASDEGWQAPEGAQTVEGQFYYQALGAGDDLETVTALLRGLFESDYWLYFRMMQALTWEDAIENEEFARRWRSGRLEDLGFPTWEEAMAVYGYLGPERRLELPEGPPPLSTEGFHLPVYPPKLPVAIDAAHLLFRAAAALDDAERRAFFFAFVALANRVAVADRMPLGDAESIPSAIEKAARLASRGLDLLARRHGEDAVTLLRRVPVDRLFRVGASLDRDERQSVASTQ